MAENEISLADAYAAPEQQQQGGGGDSEISMDEAYGKAPPAANPHDLVPFLKAQGTGIMDLAKRAGSGLVDAVKDPGKTATDIADSVASSPSDYMEGAWRAVRNTPLIGEALNKANIAARGIPGYLAGGDEGMLQAVNAQDAYEQAQNVADAKHQKEHPLTDFIQKSAGLAALPAGHMAQTGGMAVDAFTRSLSAGNDVLTALKDARNAAVLVGTALQTGKMLSEAPAAAGKWVAKEAGVQPEAIARYMEAPEAVNAAAKYANEPESLKNLVDDRVAPLNQAVDTASDTLQGAKEAVAATHTPPVSMASEIPADLDTQGGKLHDLSSQAFDILEQEGQTFPVGDLTAAVTKKMDSLKIGGEVVPSIGPDATAYKALGQFNDMLGEIGSKIGDEVPAPVVKELIQQLDGVSKESYQTNAGALSPAAAGNLAQVRRVFDQTIKEASPAYAAKMAELAPKVDIVAQMSKVFGNEPMAMTALKAAADPASPRGMFVRDILGKYDVQNGTDFAARVKDYYDQPQAALNTAQTGLQTAKDAAEGVNKLGPNSTETVLKSIQGGRNIEARRQLEGLDPDLAQTVSDAGTARQFAKTTTNGSRKAKMGAGIGGALGATAGGLMAGPVAAVVGGHVGGALGGLAGGLADMYGGQAVKTALDAGIKLEKIANTPYAKPLLEAAQKSPKTLAVVHYMMSQTDPKYQDLTSGE